VRLRSPAGTVVEADGELAEKLKRMGWSEDKPKQEKPTRPRAAKKK